MKKSLLALLLPLVLSRPAFAVTGKAAPSFARLPSAPRVVAEARVALRQAAPSGVATPDQLLELQLPSPEPGLGVELFSVEDGLPETPRPQTSLERLGELGAAGAEGSREALDRGFERSKAAGETRPLPDGAVRGRSLTLLQRPQAVSLTADFPGMLDSVRKNSRVGRLAPGAKSSYAEVAPVAEVPGAFIAVFSQRRFMNMAFGRASLYIEYKEMAAHQEVLYGRRLAQVGGHDLRGRDLLRFWEAYQKEKAKMTVPLADADMLDIETDFWELALLPMLKADPDLVVLGVSVDDYLEGIVAHEILHAQYFTQPRFQEIATRFWDEKVSAEDKEGIKATLRTYYDVEDRFLLINEFQAYILQRDAESFQLSRFLKYRKALMAELAEAGIQPLQFSLQPQAPQAPQAAREPGANDSACLHRRAARRRRLGAPGGDVADGLEGRVADFLAEVAAAQVG